MPRSAALVPVSEDTDMQLQAAPVWSLPNPSTVLNVELALPPQLVSWMRGVSEQSQRGNTEEILLQCMQEFRDYRKALHGLGGWLDNLSPYVQKHEGWENSLKEIGVTVQNMVKSDKKTG